MKTKTMFLIACLSAASHVRATANDVIYQTGFEPPTFTPGLTIGGQDGWQTFGPANAITVSTENPRSGAQCLRFKGVGITCVRSIVDQTAGNPPLKIELRADVRLDGPQTGTLGTPEQDILSANFFAAALLPGGVARQIGGFFVSSAGKIWTYSIVPEERYKYSVPAPLGVYHTLILRVDFLTRTMTFVVDGVELGSIPLHPTTVLSDQVIGGYLQLAGPPNPINTPELSYDPANYTAYFDNYSAEALALTPADVDVRFAATDYAVEESAHIAEVNVTRRGYTQSAVSVTLGTADGTATSRDYRPASSVIRFAPGETTKTAEIRIKDDALVEPDETVTLTLSAPSTSVLMTRSTAPLWILDEERAGSANPRFDFSSDGLGIPTVYEGSSIVPLQGGRFLAAVFGEDASFNYVGALARFKADGSVDRHFEPYPLPYGTGRSQITPIPGDWRWLVNLGDRLVRLNDSGREDSNFNVMTKFGSDPGFISDIEVQPDQKIIIAGFFDSVNGVPRQHIARLRLNGEVDASFDPGAGTDDYIVDAALQQDGKIVIGGSFQNVGGQPQPALARLNRNGSVDSSLSLGTGFGDSLGGFPNVQTIAIQRDGKILAGGIFDSYQAAQRVSLVRLHRDGSLDTSFDTGDGFRSGFLQTQPGFIGGLTLQQDGKLLVTGGFGYVNGVWATGVVRLKPDGALDPTFQVGGTDSIVATLNGGPAMALLPGGDILTFLSSNVSFLRSEPVQYRGIVRLKGDSGCDDNDRDDRNDRHDDGHGRDDQHDQDEHGRGR